MKINFPAKVKKWVWKFRLVSLLLCFFSLNAFSQTSEKTFVKEINVSDNITVISNVPTSLDIEREDARYSSGSNTKFGYIIYGKYQTELLYIHKDYAINTWDKNVVRQEVEIKVKSNSEINNQAFLSQLKIELEQNNQSQILIDASMNLEKFKLTNSSFRKDICKIILQDGKSFTIDYLEVKTSLYIPKTANLKVNSILNHTLRLGDLEGDLDLDIQYGEVYGNKIKNLNANLRFCYNVIFKEAENVNASATESHLKIDKVKHLRIGEKKLTKGLDVKGEFKQWMDNNSSMNLYNFREVEKMIISDTANDKFTIGEVDDLEIKSSIYSNYKILKLNNVLNLNARNGDVSISEVSKDFKTIDLHNTLSNLNINIADDGNYGINIFDIKSIDYKLPNSAKLIEKEPSKNAQFKMGNDENTGIINIQCERCELDIWD